eukprot:CAMPEP_0174908318 /NCGR_PEP_ID=MMETSP0167-20121228/64292_1 /TAXON_ID=38298 /ORGANISM="Rhodella maculata, Strain CCMP736" /LENGTH=203 /DNA_ID=CAMNT_0016152043 /DNA_START=118 /DNA_END=726 /DNA_ORIENTATION=-
MLLSGTYAGSCPGIVQRLQALPRLPPPPRNDAPPRHDINRVHHATVQPPPPHRAIAPPRNPALPRLGPRALYDPPRAPHRRALAVQHANCLEYTDDDGGRPIAGPDAKLGEDREEGEECDEERGAFQRHGGRVQFETDDDGEKRDGVAAVGKNRAEEVFLRSPCTGGRRRDRGGRWEVRVGNEVDEARDEVREEVRREEPDGD